MIAANMGEDIALCVPQGIVYKDLLNGQIYRNTVTIKKNRAEIFKAMPDTKEAEI